MERRFSLIPAREAALSRKVKREKLSFFLISRGSIWVIFLW